MNSNTKSFPLLALLALSSALAVLPLSSAHSASLARAAGPAVGKAAPEIEGTDLDGKKMTLSSYRGKVVLIDFWGDW